MNAGKKKPGKWRKDAHLWARDPDDYYVEPRWADAALFASIRFSGLITDPCCGSGRILDAAQDAGYETLGMDIKNRGAGGRHMFVVADFFNTVEPFQNIVCNPPYLHGDKFVREALSRAKTVAVLLRAQWANAGERSKWLESAGLRHVLMITPRPSMPPGAVIEAAGGKDPSGGQQDYAWFVFFADYTGPTYFGWARRPAKAKPQERLL